MRARIEARRAELLKMHEELATERATVSANLERVRGALALCDELLQAAAPTEEVPPGDPPPAAEPAA